MALTDNTTSTPAAGAKDCKNHAATYTLVAGETLGGKVTADAALSGAVPAGKKATISVQVQVCIEQA